MKRPIKGLDTATILKSPRSKVPKTQKAVCAYSEHYT